MSVFSVMASYLLSWQMSYFEKCGIHKWIRGLVSSVKKLWCSVDGEWKRMFGFINRVDREICPATVKRFEC